MIHRPKIGWFVRTALCVLVVAVAAALCAAQEPASGVWFDDLGESLTISRDDGKALVAQIHARLAGDGEAKDKAIALPESLAADKTPRIVFLSLSDGQTAARVVVGAGQGLKAVVEAALAEAAPLVAAGLKLCWLKLDIVTGVEKSVDLEPATGRRFDRSLYGLAFDRQSRIAFVPEQLVANNLVDELGRLWANNVSRYLESAGDRKEAFLAVYGRPQLSGFLFQTQSFFCDGTRSLALYRGHAASEEMPDLGPERLLEASRQAGAYFVRTIDDQGRFDYLYLPGHDQELDRYNILRHAGSTYSLLELYQVDRDEATLKAAERAADYILKHVVPTPSNDESMRCIAEDGTSKLGGNALAIIALAKHVEVTGRRDHVETMQRLGHWMVSLQDADGQFQPHTMTYPEGRGTGFVSQYYPGETLLALVRLHGVDGQAAWLDAAEKGAKWLITVRDGQLADSQLSHDHWLLYALNELYRCRRNELYLKHAQRLARVIVAAQMVQADYPDWVGGYLRPPRSTSTSTRSEGLCAAWWLERDFGQAEQARAILDAARRGVAFQLLSQLRPESVLYAKDPQRSLGAFRRSLTNMEVRIDYVQHSMSAMLALRRILLAASDNASGTPPQGEPQGLPRE